MSAPDETLAAALAAATVVDDFFPFAALPPALAHKIFAALPADTRLRCAEVCRDWRAMVAERSLWTRLDLSDTSGMTHRVTPALLRAAATKAGGALEALDASGGVWRLLFYDEVGGGVLADTGNAGTLRELRCLRGHGLDGGMGIRSLEALLRAAPQLRACEVDVLAYNAAEVHPALRNEGVFRPLRVHSVSLQLYGTDAATLVSLFADMAAHASTLAELALMNAAFDAPEVLDAFVDVALSLPRLRTVSLFYCRLSPASAPALTRLLSSGMLRALMIDNEHPVLLDAPAAELLGDALRANATLTALTLRGMCLWNDMAAVGALLRALTGHVSLQVLRLTGMSLLAGSVDDMRRAGALLGALIAADAPALTALEVKTSRLGDEGLRPLFEALPANSHLRELNCSDNRMSDTFAADVLLPAVRANTSLRTLITHKDVPHSDAAREATVLVARRGS
jgi:hypothetical protein